MELLGFPDITDSEESKINNFLNFVEIVPINSLVTDKTISLRRITRLKLPDAIIAATAIVNEFTLISCDSSLSKAIPELQSINPLA